MPRFDARVRWIRRTRAFVLLALTLAGAAPAAAAELRLPAAAAATLPSIAAQCPTCAATGYTACGDPDVGWGRRWAPHALLGTPPRSYLPTFTLSGDDFRTLARSTDHGPLLAALRTRFAATRLVVLDDAFTAARVLPPPATIAITFPKPLHDCLRDPTRPWSCCTPNCHHECCEKSLGSPTVTLEWPDGTERITFHYSHTIGLSWLDRSSGNQRTRYACLSDAKGELRSSEAHR